MSVDKTQLSPRSRGNTRPVLSLEVQRSGESQMSRIIPLVVAVLISPYLTGQVFAQLTPPAGTAGAGLAPINGIPYGPANPRPASDPSGIGNYSSVPPL